MNPLGHPLGHWNYPHEFNPNEYFGFCYMIINNKNGRCYIGKKQFRTHRKCNGRVISFHSDWKDYTSSSETVMEAILLSGYHNFSFEILSLHKTREELEEAEIALQLEFKVLTAKLPNGQKMFYNFRIG